jgi:hypothetical protein
VFIDQVFRRHDPEGLYRMGVEGDPYRVEAEILFDRVSREPLTAQYVRDVWLFCFATGTSRRPRDDSSYPWVGDMPMRPVFELIAKEINALVLERGP